MKRLVVLAEKKCKSSCTSAPSFDHKHVKGGWPDMITPNARLPTVGVTRKRGCETTMGVGCHSSHPMDGGFSHDCPSMSLPETTSEVPAARQGDVLEMWTPSGRHCGSALKLLLPGGEKVEQV